MDKHGTEPPIRGLVTLILFPINIIKIFLYCLVRTDLESIYSTSSSGDSPCSPGNPCSPGILLLKGSSVD